MDLDALEHSILSKITPDDADREKIAKLNVELQEQIKNIVKELGLEDVTPVLVGSVAKDTHLKTLDLDIFIMFPSGTPRDKLEKYGLKIGYRVLPDAVEQYAEHPYLRGVRSGIKIDLVPCYNIKSSKEKMSAVDRTPFHTKYVKEHLTDGLKPDVRLFKQFLKGIGAYGAEIRYQGFSGYLCEVLVIEYGGFHEVLENVVKWELPGQLIIPSEVKNDFDKATLGKFIEPLIVIDPVDETRNVGSPVSMETLGLLQLASSDYLSDPSEEFFFPNKPKPLPLEELEEILGEGLNLIIGIDIRCGPILPDVLYGQVRKSLKAVETILERCDFSTARSKFFVNENLDGTDTIRILLLLQLDVFELPATQTHRGPPADHPNSESFLKKWHNNSETINEPYLERERWHVDIKRKHTSASDLLQAQFKDLNHGKQLNEFIQNDEFEIFSGMELVKEQYAQELTEFILNKHPWTY